MQVTFYKSDSSPKAIKNPEALQVRLPGYVSTSSWAGSSCRLPGDDALSKSRELNPPPAMHHLRLEAFWLD